MMNVDEKTQWILDIEKKIDEKMKWVSIKSRNKIPSTTYNGIHDDKGAMTQTYVADDGINWWTNGFWSGIMWLMYHKTGEKNYVEIANMVEEKLDRCFSIYTGLHHDVGFMWILSSVANYKLTNNRESKKRALHAANLLAGRFNPIGKFIRAWNDDETDGHEDRRGWAIIDCMLNLSLLYWASEETKDPRFKQIAIMHADTVSKYFIRDNGSVNHIVEFNAETGDFVKSHGGQGYSATSSWTRGQAWAIYGFVISFKHTQKKEYLDIAKKVADYFISKIPENGIIPVDFEQPIDPAWEDSAAAAIAAGGLIELSKIMEVENGSMYLTEANRILKNLGNSRCDWTKDNDCIILNCSGAYHYKEHHYSLIYADYYFIEAIFKLIEKDLFVW